MIHTTVEAFAEATGFSPEMVRVHNITSYGIKSGSGTLLHFLRECDGEYHSAMHVGDGCPDCGGIMTRDPSGIGSYLSWEG